MRQPRRNWISRSAGRSSGDQPRHRSSTGAEQETARIDEFLSRFFGAGNDAGLYPEIIEPFMQSLRRGRRRTGSPAPLRSRNVTHFALYVIAPGPSGCHPDR